jgi:AraC-like DNA-binding protein
MKDTRLPLVQLSVLQPFINELWRRDMDPSSLLEAAGLSMEAISDPDRAVHAMVIHQLLENIADFTQDPTIGSKVGKKLDTSGWPVLVEVGVQSKTLGDFLTRFISQVNEVASSAVQYLHVEGVQSVLGEKRTIEPSVIPAQNDAFMASLALSILRRSVADQLIPSDVIMVVSDPDVLSPEYGMIQKLKGDALGFRLLFPTEWLSMPFHWDRYREIEDREKSRIGQSADLVHAFRQVLKSHVGRGRLTAVAAARLVDMDRQKLARMLARHGTSISAIIEQAQFDYAKTRIAGGDSITNIALALGYSNPANFSRSFRRAAGVSPREYRKAADFPAK